MKKTIAAVALLLLAAVPGLAGRYDSPDFLTGHLVSGGPPKDGIPALTNPQFVPPSGVSYVAWDDLVIGVYINGVAKAYPENLGWWHEIINDEIGGQFISVTFCPLTGTAMVFAATDTDGSQIQFGVSGLLINSNLVMFDRSDGETLFPQMIYTAINGDSVGDRLELLPAVDTTWAMWKKLHPDTRVAAAGTGWDYYEGKRTPYPYERYTEYPYISFSRDYRTSNEYLLFLPSTNGGELDPRYAVKDVVLGICREGETRAYPFADMPDGAVINDRIGDQSLVVVFDADSHTAIPYSSDVGGDPLNFYAVESEGSLLLEFMDIETGSRWNMLGEAIAGPLAGERLVQMPAYNAMWFAWAAYWPETSIWKTGAGIIDPPPPVTAIAELGEAVPDRFALQQNIPNPFNPQTHIRYQLPHSGQVSLSVFNAAGQQVRILVDEYQNAGSYLQTWDGRDQRGIPAASGTYFYRLELPASGLSESRAMSLVR